MIQPIWTENTQSQIYQDSLAIRFEIFIDEQGYPDDSELDELEEETIHLVLYEDDRAIATNRIYQINKDTYRIERVAVRKIARKRGLGERLLKEAEDKIIELGGKYITIKSEDIAIEFYKRFGYKPVGDEIMEYGFSHQAMTKEI